MTAASEKDTPHAQDALGRLCAAYWYPLYAYVRRRGYAPADAQDLTQEFFARLLQRKGLGKADQERGRFRSFLLSSMNHFLSDEWDKATAQKRGGLSPPLRLGFHTAETRYSCEPVENVTPEQVFEHRWALALLDEVLAGLQAEYRAEGKAELFDTLKPCLTCEGDAYARLGPRLNLSQSAIKSAVHRLRKRYRCRLREAIAQTVSAEREIEDELNYLFTILARQ